MSSDIAIRVQNVSKNYHIYNAPRDRLKQFLLPKLRRMAGLQEQQFYKDFWALNNVSFEVKRGESVGILGRNGSGKSTLLQLITGTLTPTTGTIDTNGRIAALLELGSGFNPEFSGRENVFLNGSLLGLSREQLNERFDEIAAFADIGEFIDQPVKTYSSGMLVRLAFAVQVQVSPDILIVDEALAVGDALFQKRCFQRLERLMNDGVTLLFVSHDIESVRTLTNRSLLLKNGMVERWGTTSDVILEYRRQLHEEESQYFTELTERISKNTHTEKSAPNESTIESSSDVTLKRSENLSFGDGGVYIKSVETTDEDGNSCKIFYPNDIINIKITCHSKVDINHLNVGVRIRNKEGIKIYSWGTLNQDMSIISTNGDAALFWNKSISSGDTFTVYLSTKCNLGQNLYEIQAAISYEETPDYYSQRLLHWQDEAALFQVNVKREEHFFGGIVDMHMFATWDEDQ